MTCSFNLTGLDLEVRNRVGPCTIGEQEIAVQLVGVGAFCCLANENIAYPNGVCLGSLERALVSDSRLAVWL